MGNVSGTNETKRKRGRPPSEDPRIHTIQIRLTDSEYAQMKEIADGSEVTISEFVRGMIVDWYNWV